MDSSRFDGITRAVATSRTRRRALQALGGGALAGLLGVTGVADTAAAPCRGKRKKCGAKCVNTKKDNKHCGKCNNACQGQNSCKNGKCTSKLGCKAGQGLDICETLEEPPCPGRGNCACLTDVQGGAHCSDLTDGACFNCRKNADCGPGEICIALGCDCDDFPGSNGNACISATCDGITGSGAGGGPARSRLLR